METRFNQIVIQTAPPDIGDYRYACTPNVLGSAWPPNAWAASAWSTESSPYRAVLHDARDLQNEDLIVIDFDDCGFGWRQNDLAVALLTYSERSDFDVIVPT